MGRLVIYHIGGAPVVPIERGLLGDEAQHVVLNDSFKLHSARRQSD